MDKIQRKQEIMVEEAEKLTKKVTGNALKVQQAKKESVLRRAVYNTIVELMDTVDEDTLLQKLNNLDVSSWWEVVEERFLSHLCGFPTCSNIVEMKPMSIYRIDRKQMKIFERCTEKQKFCSKDCFLRSAYVLSQLAEEPLWIRGYRQQRTFNLNPPPSQQKAHQPEAKEIKEIKFIKEKVITKLADLHIGESADTEDERSDEEEANVGSIEEDRVWRASRQRCNDSSPMRVSKNHLAEKDIVKEEKVTHESGDPLAEHFSNKDNDAQISSSDLARDRNRIKHDAHVESPSSPSTASTHEDEAMLNAEEKLARIRAKYSPKKIKRAPVIVEAKPLDLSLKAKVADTAFEDFEKIAKEWVGDATIAYLQRRGTVDFFDDDALSEAETLMMQFYLGDRAKPSNDQFADMVLPRVDRYDQTIARRDVLIEALSTSWRMLEHEINAEGCARKAFPLITTFTLTADNVNIDKCEARVAVAFIFRLVAHCDSELLEEYFPSEGCVSASFANYLEAIDLPLKVFNRMITHVMGRLTSA